MKPILIKPKQEFEINGFILQWTKTKTGGANIIVLRQAVQPVFEMEINHGKKNKRIL